jgi:hypothetical protein
MVLFRLLPSVVEATPRPFRRVPKSPIILFLDSDFGL